MNAVKTLLVGASFSAATLLPLSASAAPVTYKVDAAHTTAQFIIGHLGVSRTVGRFNELEGSYQIDADNPAANSVELTIQAASIDTNHTKRDDHLRSPDFLDVNQFPTLTFKSSSYQGNDAKGVITGDLTLHGVTKEVSFEVEKVGEGKDPWGGYRNGFVASTTINRSDFGVSYFIPGVTDATEITLFIEGIRQ
ncbi:YceI family protein [Motiliproteus sediminis]|uniref:YceI family protein n=1 Tax=Motiliproteus sediminis TaxID=1468178 RepID=UPI001AF00556|nr:YceI family protein [Motiliproteus sediminis]